MTSARISWTLPPEELFDPAYIPSLWAVWKMALLTLIAAVRGPLSINDLSRNYRGSGHDEAPFVGYGGDRVAGDNVRRLWPEVEFGLRIRAC
jgi:hypothetical protein